MAAAAEDPRQRREIDFRIGAAAEAHALAAQVEQRDHRARLSLVERRRNFAAIAEAAGAADLDAVVEHAIYDRGARELERLRHRLPPGLQRRAHPPRQLRFAQAQNLAVRLDPAER